MAQAWLNAVKAALKAGKRGGNSNYSLKQAMKDAKKIYKPQVTQSNVKPSIKSRKNVKGKRGTRKNK